VNRRVLVINGPNLNRLGTREPDIYGTTSYSELVELVIQGGNDLGLSVEVRQTASESEMITWLHEASDSQTPVILNPAAFTHYSYAIRDACALLTAPLIEVHISNPSSREEFRHHSVISGVATGVIAGFGTNSYLLALRAISTL
jgi:3-dehydroquinate dehydratase-2